MIDLISCLSMLCPTSYPPVWAIMGQGGHLINCCSLAKEHPWAEHLTNLSKRGVGILLNVAALTMKERPCHVTAT